MSIILNPGAYNLATPALARLEKLVEGAVKSHPSLPYGFSALDCVMIVLFSNNTSLKYAAKSLAVKIVDVYVTSEEQLIASGKSPKIASDQYLKVGPIAQEICYTLEVCGEVISDTQRARWLALVGQAVRNLENPQDNSWGGKAFSYPGWANTPALPGNNYFFSHLLAVVCFNLMTGKAVAYLESRLTLLVNYWLKFNGGGSPEGTGYGDALARLFETIRLFQDSTGRRYPTIVKLASETIDYYIHCTDPTFTEIAAFGDQARVSRPFISDPIRNVMLQARALSGSPAARARASWWLTEIPISRMSSSAQYRNDLLDRGTIKAAPVELRYHAEGAGHYFERTSWKRDAWYMTFACGRNDESHDHDDQGSVMLYHNGPVIVPQTLWERTGIRGEPEFHSGVRFVGPTGKTIRQRTDAVCSITVSETDERAVRGDITPAYSAASGITHARKLVLQPGSLRIQDSFSQGNSTDQVWQLQTPLQPRINSNNSVSFGDVRLEFAESVNLTVIDWTKADPTNARGGYRIEARGHLGEVDAVVQDSTLTPPDDNDDDNDDDEDSQVIEELQAKIKEQEEVIATLTTRNASLAQALVLANSTIAQTAPVLDALKIVNNYGV